MFSTIQSFSWSSLCRRQCKRTDEQGHAGASLSVWSRPCRDVLSQWQKKDAGSRTNGWTGRRKTQCRGLSLSLSRPFRDLPPSAAVEGRRKDECVDYRWTKVLDCWFSTSRCDYASPVHRSENRVLLNQEGDLMGWVKPGHVAMSYWLQLEFKKKIVEQCV